MIAGNACSARPRSPPRPARTSSTSPSTTTIGPEPRCLRTRTRSNTPLCAAISIRNPLGKLRRDIARRAAELKAQGRNAYAASLTAKAEQLKTLADLQGSNAVIASPAGLAAKIEPRPKRYGLFGLALGLVLGVGLAFLRDALDTRVRGAEDVIRRTGLALLARIPEPPRKLQRDEELVMFKQPASVEAEAFRVLRTNLDFAGLDHDVRSIMITSALEKEGKSTTISNLAIVEARSGKRVVLVDLDLRRPRIDKFFKLKTNQA